jgi:dihydroorotate dehydrogenase
MVLTARQGPGPGMVLSASGWAWRPLGHVVRGPDAQVGHARALAILRLADRSALLAAMLGRLSDLAFPARPTTVGGVRLNHPLILAAGLVKGDGFEREPQALAAVRAGRDIVPGWRTLPALLGAVEFGSYTRHPRLGNPGRVLWRDDSTRSMQNRVGLRNPGAEAAAAYLGSRPQLPGTWGVSLAVSPGVHDLAVMERELREAGRAFSRAFHGRSDGPAWFTLNLSCPNTEDDPQGRQTGDLARRLCAGLRETVSGPLWVKVGPDLSTAQLERLVRTFQDDAVGAVVATNTLARPAPAGGTAGLSGAALRPMSLDTVRRLRAIIGDGHEAPDGPDIVACGGILEGRDLHAFQSAGARAAMLYSALVWRGPLAPAHILREADRVADA